MENRTPDRPLRVLAVSETLALGGGAERLLATLIPKLTKLGVVVDTQTLFEADTSLGPELRAQGCRVFDLGMRPRRGTVRILRALRARIRAGRYDVVWGHLLYGNLFASIAAASARCPSVVTLHSHQLVAHQSWKTHVERQLERNVTGRMASCRVAVSNGMADFYRTSVGWPDVRTIHNGADLASFPTPPAFDEANALRSRHGIPSDAFVFVMPARYVWTKRHDLALHALRILKERGAPLPVVFAPGAGPLFDRVAADAVSLGLDDAFLVRRAVPHDELLRAMSACDGALLTSMGESFGITAIEAMGLGLPAIITEVDGFTEVVGTSGCALMVPPGDASSLADAMSRLMADVDLRHELGALGKARVVSEFGIDRCAARWASLLREVACASDAGAANA